MRSSNKLNFQNGGEIISNLKNGVIPIFRNGAAWISDLLTFKIEYNQLLAMWMICALLLPFLAAPASISAAMLKKQDAAEEDYSQFEPINGEQSALSYAATELNLGIERLFSSSLKVTGGSASIEDEKLKSDDNAKEENASENEFVNSADETSESKDVKSSSENLTAADKSEILPVKNKTQSGSINNSAVQSALLNNPLPDNEKDSVYSYENNLGSPVGQTEMDSSNLAAAIPIRQRAGIANFNFGISLFSLSGRGMDAAVNMTYNSRIWNKSVTADPNNPSQSVNRYTYDVEESWIAPGFSTGFGYLESSAIVRSTHYMSSNFSYYTEITPQGITDADGGRHQMACINWTPIPNTHETKCTAYQSNDGSFINIPPSSWLTNTGNSQNPNTSNYSSIGFTVSYSNGTKIWYSGAFGSGTTRKHYPIIIQDNNGNRIRITYKTDNSGRIDYITDTLSRQIKFYYENNASGNPDKLIAVTVPGMNQNEEIQTIRFYYEDGFALTPKTPTGGFEANSVVAAPATTRVLKYVYFPSTKSGFKYDYHSNYGMIKKISRMVGMSVSDESLMTATGTVLNAGNWAATTTYDYPDGNTIATDVPTYTKRTDDWQGISSTSPSETFFDVPEPITGGDRISRNSVKDREYNRTSGTYTNIEIINETLSHYTADWKDGLVKETSVRKKYQGGLQPTVVLTTVKYFWEQGQASYGRQHNPILRKTEITNEVGQTKTIRNEYDQYNNPTAVEEYDFGKNETNSAPLRRTEMEYENGTGWMNANLPRLVKSVKTMVGGTVVSKTLYEYDHNGNDSAIVRRDDIDTATHSTFYNPARPAQTETVCPDNDPYAERGGRCITINTPGYSSASAYRGNLTKITAFSNAALSADSNAHVTNYNHDIAGNVVAATLSCCQMKTIDYGATFAETGYAFPTKETRGASPQITSEATYNKNAGLVTSIKNENNQITTFEYETDTLRQSRTNYPNGGYTITEYSDKLAPGSLIGFIRTKTTLDNSNTVQSYSYFDGRGFGIRNASETTNGWSVSAMEYDSLGRTVKSYNPFYASTPNGGIAPGTAFTEVMGYDALGRKTQIKLQDGATINNYYNEETATVTVPGSSVSLTGTSSRTVDQAGRERRQVADSLGRVMRVDEPTGNGLGNVSAPNQPTYYLYDGNNNLTDTIQSIDGITQTQVRKFRFDSLSRLTHERQVEASRTLDNNGVKGAVNPGNWTKVLKYSLDGLISESTDARGIKTTFTYDGLNRVSQIAYSDDTPTITYTYDQSRTGFYNKGELTRIETASGGANREDTPATATEFDYDKMGNVVKHRQSIGSQIYNLEYGYNLAGQLISEKYPSGRTVSSSYDAKGRLSQIADANRTYLSNLQFQGKGNTVSSVTYGNGTTQNFTLNDRLQMTGQELKRGTENLQKYDYGYGQINTSTGTITANSNNGQLAKVESTIGTNKQFEQRFGYDSVGRLSESRENRGDNGNLSYKQRYDYDRFGNLYRKNSANSTTGQQTPINFTPIEDTDISKSTNRFTTDTTYDDAGNVIQDTKYRNQNFWYDANGRIYRSQKINFPNQSNSVYDASGVRVGTQVDGVWTFSIYDIGGKKVAEYGGLQTADEGGVKYVLSDRQGSNRAVVNNAGFVNNRIDYTAFGEEINSGIGQRTTTQGFGSSNTPDQKYALTERDRATGLDHTWFRKHENRAGRWTSPDPYGGSQNIGNPQSFNRYSYVENQPTNFTDSSGLQQQQQQTLCQWWGNFNYPNGFNNPEGRTQIGNSWLVCWTVSSGGAPNYINLPGGGGTTLDLDNAQNQDRNKSFADCVALKVGRIQEKLDIQVSGIRSRADSEAGVAFSLGLLAIDIEVIVALTGVGTLPGIIAILATVVITGVAIAAMYAIAVSEENEARRLGQLDVDDAFEDCAKENNVTLGPAPVPLPLVPK